MFYIIGIKYSKIILDLSRVDSNIVMLFSKLAEILMQHGWFVCFRRAETSPSQGQDCYLLVSFVAWKSMAEDLDNFFVV